MSVWSQLATRNLQPELIDQPDLPTDRLQGALVGLERINLASGSARIVWAPIRKLAREAPDRPLRVLDVASGAGDVPIALWHKARKAGLSVTLHGCDINPRSIEFAKQRASHARADVEFFEHDALGAALPRTYDVVTCSLFLHHLTTEQAVELLRRMASAAARLVLVNDLIRGAAGYGLAWLGTRILSRSPVVHSDGPRSVEGAFTRSEAAELARRAGLANARVNSRWPCRYLLSWQRV